MKLSKSILASSIVLGTVLEDPSVDTSIKWALDNDPSWKVKKLAKQVLANG